MGKLKNALLNDLTQEELEIMLYNREEGRTYEEWLESDEFVEYVNSEIDTTRPIYSESDIMNAIRYASKQIQIEPSEVGKSVYDMLFSEKIEEYLSLYRDGRL
jgi:hypothetical protein